MSYTLRAFRHSVAYNSLLALSLNAIVQLFLEDGAIRYLYCAFRLMFISATLYGLYHC
ncbi:uncharacterized protein BO72DRAFT_449979 [Aspergillus fijiensis CBS 313.89]|uniref:Uncharacterized protein n=1 Tax=Aspergillus fijiensis CBS 313.89 TaxID=1448319 RepID=A0A8G1RNS7_9EURO|nr:uncharacterized protein BO72DRAFT_449979 [Aspergillus fijiensis CBS 313.89]RAK75190.1 hypothetical protein BO72DRAFT_449979 [Aspergillus fijiensis CBS 313.89]